MNSTALFFLDTFQKTKKKKAPNIRRFFFFTAQFMQPFKHFYKAFPHKKINRQRAKNIFGRTFSKCWLSCAHLNKNLNIFFENFGWRENWFHFEIARESNKKRGSDIFPTPTYVLCATYTDVKKGGGRLDSKKETPLSLHIDCLCLAGHKRLVGPAIAPHDF